VQIVLIRL